MWKGTICRGLVVGALILALTGGIAAYAATGQRALTADFRDIKIVIDGELLTPKDANGAVVEPFIVDGTTYLPVRAIAEAFGKDVGWDGETSTVTITSKDTPTTAETSNEAKLSDNEVKLSDNEVKLSDFDYLAEAPNANIWATGEFQANTADFLQDSIAFNHGNGFGPFYREYKIDGEYKRITGSVFLSYGTRSSTSTYYFRIWGDEELLYTSEKIAAGFLPQAFDVDISGVTKLKIEFTRDFGLDSASLGVSGVILHK